MSFSKIVKKVSVVGAFGLMGLMGSDSAQAASFQGDSATLDVSVTVDANCTIGSSGTLAFPAYNFSNSAAYGSQATATIDVTCSDGVDWSVHLNGGARGDSTMIGTTPASGTSPGNAGEILPYLVSDTLGGAPLTTFGDTGDASVQPTTLYGTIAAGLAPSDGVYGDTITADLWY